MDEIPHLIEILKNTKESLKNYDTNKLKDLSNQTIHHASTHQDVGCVSLAVLIYALSKLIERRDYKKIKNWDKSIKKLCSFFDLAETAAKEENDEKFEEYLERARKTLTSISVNLKPYIQEVLRKASINKASKIYEHGISMGRTAKILGITQWELTEYSGQKQISDNPYNEIIDVKKRAKTALEFFS